MADVPLPPGSSEYGHQASTTAQCAQVKPSVHDIRMPRACTECRSLHIARRCDKRWPCIKCIEEDRCWEACIYDGFDPHEYVATQQIQNGMNTSNAEMPSGSIGKGVQETYAPQNGSTAMDVEALSDYAANGAQESGVPQENGNMMEQEDRGDSTESVQRHMRETTLDPALNNAISTPMSAQMNGFSEQNGGEMHHALPARYAPSGSGIYGPDVSPRFWGEQPGKWPPPAPTTPHGPPGYTQLPGSQDLTSQQQNFSWPPSGEQPSYGLPGVHPGPPGAQPDPFVKHQPIYNTTHATSPPQTGASAQGNLDPALQVALPTSFVERQLDDPYLQRTLESTPYLRELIDRPEQQQAGGLQERLQRYKDSHDTRATQSQQNQQHEVGEGEPSQEAGPEEAMQEDGAEQSYPISGKGPMLRTQ